MRILVGINMQASTWESTHLKCPTACRQVADSAHAPHIHLYVCTCVCTFPHPVPLLPILTMRHCTPRGSASSLSKEPIQPATRPTSSGWSVASSAMVVSVATLPMLELMMPLRGGRPTWERWSVRQNTCSHKWKGLCKRMCGYRPCTQTRIPIIITRYNLARPPAGGWHSHEFWTQAEVSPPDLITT